MRIASNLGMDKFLLWISIGLVVTSGCAPVASSGGQVFSSRSAAPPVEPAAYYGQAMLGTTARNEVVPYRVFHPAGVHIDTHGDGNAPSRVWVFDGGNQRVLGFSSFGYCEGTSTSCTENSSCDGVRCVPRPGRSADVVIGQPSGYGYDTCNGNNYDANAPASATSLCTMPYPFQSSPLEGQNGQALDTDEHHNLYVVDKFNNRVLVYRDPLASTECPSGGCNGPVAAAAVFGQAGFSGMICNQAGDPSASSLCTGTKGAPRYDYFFSAGLDVADDGSFMWVADPGNHRVLRVPIESAAGPTITFGDADLVLGQPDFEANEDPCQPTGVKTQRTSDALCAPNAVAYDSERDRLYVLDGLMYDGRILVFENPSQNAQAPSAIWTAPLGTRFKFPRGLALHNGYLWVNDTEHHRVLRYDPETGEADRVLGQGSLDWPSVEYSEQQARAAASGTKSTLLPPTFTADTDGLFRSTMYQPLGALGIDRDGSLYVNSLIEQDVTRYANFPAPFASPDGRTFRSSDGHLFDSGAGRDGHYYINQVGSLGFNDPADVAFVGEQVAITDRRRILFWNDYREQTGPAGAADGVLGQLDAGAQEASVSTDAGKLDLGTTFNGVTYVSAHQMLYASSGRQIIAWSTPLANGAIPDSIIPGVFPYHGPVEGEEMFSCDEFPGLEQPTCACTGNNGTQLDECLVTFSAKIAVDVDQDVAWAADPFRNRVYRIANFKEGPRYVDMLLGQDSVAGTECNRGEGVGNVVADGFCDPTSVVLDADGDLYIADGTWEGRDGNRRIVRYAAGHISAMAETGELFAELTPVHVHGQTMFTNRETCNQSTMLCTPLFMAFDPSTDTMFAVGDAYHNERGHSVAFWRNAEPESNGSVAPSGFLGFKLGGAGGLAIDGEGRLAVVDHTWNRVSVYTKTQLDPMMAEAETLYSEYVSQGQQPETATSAYETTVVPYDEPSLDSEPTSASQDADVSAETYSTYSAYSSPATTGFNPGSANTSAAYDYSLADDTSEPIDNEPALVESSGTDASSDEYDEDYDDFLSDYWEDEGYWDSELGYTTPDSASPASSKETVARKGEDYASCSLSGRTNASPLWPLAFGIAVLLSRSRRKRPMRQ